MILRTFQQTPGAYPKPPTNSLWRNSFHLGVWGCLGYAPGVCWGSLRMIRFLLKAEMEKPTCTHIPTNHHIPNRFYKKFIALPRYPGHPTIIPSSPNFPPKKKTSKKKHPIIPPKIPPQKKTNGTIKKNVFQAKPPAESANR